MTANEKLKRQISILKDDVDYYKKRYDAIEKVFDKLVELKEDSEEKIENAHGAYRGRLEEEVIYLRRLIREITIPADKLKIVNETIQQIDQGRLPRNY